MRDLTSAFLSEEQRRTLQACVNEVEAASAAEIVPMVVSASAYYPQAEVSGALIVALLTATPLAYLFFGDALWPFLLLFGAFHLAARLVLRLVPETRRPFVAEAHMDEEVEEAAESAFFRHGLHRTAGATGVLVYVSVFERKVVILADSGLHAPPDARLGPQVLEQVVADLTLAIHAGRAGQGLCAAVRRLGELAGPHARPADDRDELSNLIVEHRPRR